MIDFKITFQGDEPLHKDYEKMSLILEIIFRKYLREFKTKTALSPYQRLNTPCCQGNVSEIMNLDFRF